ncbi:hypothetical protein NDU88_005480 [Pleurodeles waltl]|uniref:Uncharacterized protein n=1 Tax=Pleurodeles waltl TaxID=8319 RepID=A0AAV7TBF7_PLEWA|nr:hypothetical protein NDU88_005480 [Pleurodeles waltl]
MIRLVGTSHQSERFEIALTAAEVGRQNEKPTRRTVSKWKHKFRIRTAEAHGYRATTNKLKSALQHRQKLAAVLRRQRGKKIGVLKPLGKLKTAPPKPQNATAVLQRRHKMTGTLRIQTEAHISASRTDET